MVEEVVVVVNEDYLYRMDFAISNDHKMHLQHNWHYLDYLYLLLERMSMLGPSVTEAEANIQLE